MYFFQESARMPWRVLLRHFAFLYLIAFTILTLAIFLAIYIDSNGRIDKIKVRESARLEIANSRVLQDFSGIVEDLHLLARLPALQRFLDGHSQTQREELTRFFLLLSLTSARYDQIRYLDAEGQEVVRINFNAGQPVAVSSRELQNKAGRYFFRDTIKLNRDEIFVSPLDLNIEHDKVELPYKPMIRFGMPVFDSKGHKRGIILLNYFGEQLLGHFQIAMSGGDQRIAMLVNRDGFWLSHPHREEEWGFMLGQKERLFARDFPAEWKAIAENDGSGTLQSSAGLFVYTTIHPLQAGQSSSSGSPLPRAPSEREFGHSEYHWKAISYIPSSELSAQSLYRQQGSRVLIEAAYLLLALAVLLIAYLDLRRKQSAESLRQNETRLNEITTTMSDGLMVANPDGTVLFANPEACQLLGYSRAELLGSDMHDLVHVEPEGVPASRQTCPVLNIARNGETFRGSDEVFRRKDGSLMPVSISVSTVHREQGKGDIVIAFHDISDQKALQRELEHQARTDSLTGLNNRRYFFELAELEFSRSKRYATPLAALMLDIDHFKQINDRYGHPVGDTVLKRMSEVCLGALRENDLIGRLGGEEFAILLPQADSVKAMEIAERLRLSIAKTTIPLEQLKHFRFFVSVGVACMNEADSSLEDMLKRADDALYRAKNSGRNCVVGETAT